MTRADFIERWLGIKLSPWARRMLDDADPLPAPGYLVVNRQMTPEEIEAFKRGVSSGFKPRLTVIDDADERSPAISEGRHDG